MSSLQGCQDVKEFNKVLDDLEFYINSRKVFKKSFHEVIEND